MAAVTGSHTITSVSSNGSTGLHFLIILPIQGKKVIFRWMHSSLMENLSLSDFFSFSIRHLGIRVQCGLCSLQTLVEGQQLAPQLPPFSLPPLRWLILPDHGHQPLPCICSWCVSDLILAQSVPEAPSPLTLPSLWLSPHAVFSLRFHHTCLKAWLWPTHSCCCKFSVTGYPDRIAYWPTA